MYRRQEATPGTSQGSRRRQGGHTALIWPGDLGVSILELLSHHVGGADVVLGGTDPHVSGAGEGGGQQRYVAPVPVRTGPCHLDQCQRRRQVGISFARMYRVSSEQNSTPKAVRGSMPHRAPLPLKRHLFWQCCRITNEFTNTIRRRSGASNAQRTVHPPVKTLGSVGKKHFRSSKHIQTASGLLTPSVHKSTLWEKC